MKNTHLSPAMRVSNANMRERIPQEAIDDTVRQIAEQFDPKQIILFGSYAYGYPRPESDVDLLVVMETRRRSSNQSKRARFVKQLTIIMGWIC